MLRRIRHGVNFCSCAGISVSVGRDNSKNVSRIQCTRPRSIFWTDIEGFSPHKSSRFGRFFLTNDCPPVCLQFERRHAARRNYLFGNSFEFAPEIFFGESIRRKFFIRVDFPFRFHIKKTLLFENRKRLSDWGPQMLFAPWVDRREVDGPFHDHDHVFNGHQTTYINGLSFTTIKFFTMKTI